MKYDGIDFEVGKRYKITGINNSWYFEVGETIELIREETFKNAVQYTFFDGQNEQVMTMRTNGRSDYKPSKFLVEISQTKSKKNGRKKNAKKR